jgi:hypothetical protein
VDFLLDPVKHKYAYIFTEDGTLHRFDMLSVPGSPLPATPLS